MSMKFRCERDTLVEALSAAGRAVTTRGGALPVLAGVRMELVGDRLTVTGSDLDLTITVEVEGRGSWELDEGEAIAHPGALRNHWSVRGNGRTRIVLVYAGDS